MARFFTLRLQAWACQPYWLAFSIVKYVGAAYLLYLGIRALRSKRGQPEAETRSPDTSHSVLGQAIFTGVLNPKVALFFLAFLPQFVDPARGAALLQFLILGVTIAALDTLYELLVVYLVCRARGAFCAILAWTPGATKCLVSFSFCWDCVLLYRNGSRHYPSRKK